MSADVRKKGNKLPFTKYLEGELGRIAEIVSEVERELEIKKLHKVLKSKGRDITLRTLNSQLKTIRDEHLKEVSGEINEKKHYDMNFRRLVDIVNNKGKVQFLVKIGDKLKLKDSVKIKGKICYPPPIMPPNLLLPKAEEVLRYYKTDSDSKLYDDLISHHRGISELPSDKYYILLAAWDFHTYLLEKCFYSPILWLYAIPGRGKSRTGKGCIYVAYRGLHVESLREAHLFRWADYFKASLLLDIANISKKAKHENSEDILLQRFEKGATVTRVQHPEKGAFLDMVYYDIFGATIAATNEPLDGIINSRAIQITMPESDKIFEEDLSPEKYLDLKERLTAFRARNMYKRLPTRSKPVQGRLGDIIKPLLQMIALVKPEEEKKFLELVSQIQKERSSEEKQSTEVVVLKTILSLENTVKNGLLPIKTITKIYNTNLDQKFATGERRVGHITKKLGFKKHHGEKGANVVWNDSLIQKLKHRFDIRDKEIKKISFS